MAAIVQCAPRDHAIRASAAIAQASARSGSARSSLAATPIYYSLPITYCLTDQDPPSQVCPYEKLCRPKPCGAQVFATTGLYSCGLWLISSGLFLRVIAPMALASALAFSCAQSQPQQMGVSTALHSSVHSEHKNIATYNTMEHKQHTMNNQINQESQDTNTEGRRKRKKEKQRGR